MVQRPVRVMLCATPPCGPNAAGRLQLQPANIWFCAKDIAQLLHIHEANVARRIALFLPHERARMAIQCLQSNGMKATLMLSVLSVQGMTRLLTASKKATMGSRLHAHLLEYTNQLCASQPLASTLETNTPLMPSPNARSVTLHPSAVSSLDPNTSLGKMLASQIAQYRQSPSALLPLPTPAAGTHTANGQASAAASSAAKMAASKDVFEAEEPSLKKQFLPPVQTPISSTASSYLPQQHIAHSYATPLPPSHASFPINGSYLNPASTPWHPPSHTASSMHTNAAITPMQMQYQMSFGPYGYQPQASHQPWQSVPMTMMMQPPSLFPPAQVAMPQQPHPQFGAYPQSVGYPPGGYPAVPNVYMPYPHMMSQQPLQQQLPSLQTAMQYPYPTMPPIGYQQAQLSASVQPPPVAPSAGLTISTQPALQPDPSSIPSVSGTVDTRNSALAIVAAGNEHTPASSANGSAFTAVKPIAPAITEDGDLAPPTPPSEPTSSKPAECVEAIVTTVPKQSNGATTLESSTAFVELHHFNASLPSTSSPRTYPSDFTSAPPLLASV